MDWPADEDDLELQLILLERKVEALADLLRQVREYEDDEGWRVFEEEVEELFEELGVDL